MLNSNVLLSKKRERSKSLAKSISHNNHNKDTLITEINGFSVIELYYTESLENNLEEEDEIKNKQNLKQSQLLSAEQIIAQVEDVKKQNEEQAKNEWF